VFASETLTADSFAFNAVDPDDVRAVLEAAILDAKSAARDAGVLDGVKNSKALAADLADRAAAWMPEIQGANETQSAGVFQGMTREFAEVLADHGVPDVSVDLESVAAAKDGWAADDLSEFTFGDGLSMAWDAAKIVGGGVLVAIGSGAVAAPEPLTSLVGAPTAAVGLMIVKSGVDDVIDEYEEAENVKLPQDPNDPGFTGMTEEEVDAALNGRQTEGRDATGDGAMQPDPLDDGGEAEAFAFFETLVDCNSSTGEGVTLKDPDARPLSEAEIAAIFHGPDYGAATGAGTMQPGVDGEPADGPIVIGPDPEDDGGTPPVDSGLFL
jgi:hypothetical protein